MQRYHSSSALLRWLAGLQACLEDSACCEAGQTGELVELCRRFVGLLWSVRGSARCRRRPAEDGSTGRSRFPCCRSDIWIEKKNRRTKRRTGNLRLAGLPTDVSLVAGCHPLPWHAGEKSEHVSCGRCVAAEQVGSRTSRVGKRRPAVDWDQTGILRPRL